MYRYLDGDIFNLNYLEVWLENYGFVNERMKDVKSKNQSIKSSSTTQGKFDLFYWIFAKEDISDTDSQPKTENLVENQEIEESKLTEEENDENLGVSEYNEQNDSIVKLIKFVPSSTCECTIIAKWADITKERVDAIVSAANIFLQNQGGIARAIEDAGGEDVKLACEEIIKNKK